jgi:hypothetical protein
MILALEQKVVQQKIADSFAWFASNGNCQEKKMLFSVLLSASLL